MRSSSGNRRACSRPRRLRIGDPGGRFLGGRQRAGPDRSISGGPRERPDTGTATLSRRERAIQRRIEMRCHPAEEGTMNEAARAGGRSPDVIVVGGGVTGTSIAWRLAQAGHHVLLLERRGICAGASGRNAGNTGAGSRMHRATRSVRALYAITTANYRLLKTLSDELDKDFELTLSGSMDVITTPEQMAHARE